MDVWRYGRADPLLLVHTCTLPHFRTDRGSGRERPPAPEHGDGGEEVLEFRGKQAVTPVDGRAEGAVPRFGIALPRCQQVDAFVEPGEELAGRERRQPRRGEFEREGKSLQPPADTGHRPGIGLSQAEAGSRGPRPVQEEGDTWEL